MIWEDEDGFLAQLKNKNKYGLFMDMGTGKTSLTLALIDYKIFAEGVKKILIITPKKVSLTTWQKEIKKFSNFNYMSSVLRLIDGDKENREKILSETTDNCIHIVSSSLIGWLMGTFVKRVSKKTGKEYKVFIPNKQRPNYDLVVVDECSQFKDTTTDRFKALKILADKKLFLLSGTFFSNIRKVVDKRGIESYIKADEMYYAFYLLGIYKGSLTDFRNDFCYTIPWEKYTYRMTPSVYDLLIETIHNFSVTKKLDIKVSRNEYIVKCEANYEMFQKLVKKYYVESDGNPDVLVYNKQNMINKSLQLANGFVYDEMGKMIRINTYKFDKLKEILSVINDRIIIFYNFVEDKEYLLENLKDAVLFRGVEEEDRWNRGEIKIMILSPFSDKYGLNLQFGGHTIIWFGLVWSAESYSQANGRVHRRGQENDVDIIYLIADGTYDMYVYHTLAVKTMLVDEFLSYTKGVAEKTR